MTKRWSRYAELQQRQRIQRLEHECEIQGHEADCDYCQGRRVQLSPDLDLITDLDVVVGR